VLGTSISGSATGLTGD